MGDEPVACLLRRFRQRPGVRGGLATVDLLLEPRHPVPPVASLELGEHPVVGSDLTSTCRRSTAARHGEAAGSRVCGVDDRCLVARLQVSSRGDLVRSDVPERRVAAVVGEADLRARRQHEVGVVIDRTLTPAPPNSRQISHQVTAVRAPVSGLFDHGRKYVAPGHPPSYRSGSDDSSLRDSERS